jgi:hypothetical protein
MHCTLCIAAHRRAEPCAGARCAFWEPGGAVLPGGCVIERLGVEVRGSDIAMYLLELRERLDEARNLREAADAQREFARRIGLEL